MLLQRLRSIFNRPLHLWLCLWFAVTLLYLPAWKGGYQQDFQGWLQIYEELPFWQLLNRQFAAVNSFYHLTQLQLFLLTKAFGVNQLPWFLLFTALHALVGTTLYRLCRNIFQDLNLANAAWVAATGTLLALLNPSMTEVVVWKAAYHYHIAMLGVLWMLIWARHYMLTGERKWIWRSLLLLLALTFTLEIWYTIPALVFLLVLAYWRADIITKEQMLKAFRLLLAPQLGIFILHLVAYRTVYGKWLAHSAFTSTGDDNLFIIAGRFWSYEWHLLGMGRFFPHEYRQYVYNHFGGYWGGMLAILFIACLTEWTWLRYHKWSPSGKAAALLGAWALVALVLVLHFIPPDILLVANDRYLYFTAFFQWMLVALCIAQLFRSKLLARNITFGAVLLICLGFTAKLVMVWRHSTKVFWAVQDKFIWKDAPVVLILNMPCTYNGVGIITGSPVSELSDHLRVFKKGKPAGQVYDVSSYNMQHPWDGANVVVQDSSHLHVTLNQWGSWWWLRGFGAQDRSTDLFDLHFIDGGHDYMLTLKQRPPGMVILFQQGQEWRVVDMSRIGQEQR
jgi:hypothetical protein